MGEPFAVSPGGPGADFTRRHPQRRHRGDEHHPSAAAYRLTYPGKGTLIDSARFRGMHLPSEQSAVYNQHIEAVGARCTTCSIPLIRAIIQVESQFGRPRWLLEGRARV